MKGQVVGGRQGFTLVELLVVIGIIALLISILLPALAKARQQAQITQCASNMKQIATAMLSYAYDNKGILPPSVVSAPEATWPNGWFWATELVEQKYISAPLATYTAASAGGTTVLSNNPTPFLCPACDNTNGLIQFTGTISGVTTYPTDGGNNQSSSILASNGNPDLSWGNTGVCTWYMPVATVYFNGASSTPPQTSNGGIQDVPFLWFEPKTGTTSTVDADLRSNLYRRNLSQVIHSDSMAMLLEGNASDIIYNPGGGAQANGYVSMTPRLAARHGQKTLNGYDAFTNIAFFDGHVALFPTAPFSAQGWDPGIGSGTGASTLTSGWPNVCFVLHLNR